MQEKHCKLNNFIIKLFLSKIFHRQICHNWFHDIFFPQIGELLKGQEMLLVDVEKNVKSEKFCVHKLMLPTHSSLA